jgi:hypothetical protein
MNVKDSLTYLENPLPVSLLIKNVELKTIGNKLISLTFNF